MTKHRHVDPVTTTRPTAAAHDAHAVTEAFGLDVLHVAKHLHQAVHWAHVAGPSPRTGSSRPRFLGNMADWSIDLAAWAIDAERQLSYLVRMPMHRRPQETTTRLRRLPHLHAHVTGVRPEHKTLRQLGLDAGRFRRHVDTALGTIERTGAKVNLFCVNPVEQSDGTATECGAQLQLLSVHDKCLTCGGCGRTYDDSLWTGALLAGGEPSPGVTQ